MLTVKRVVASIFGVAILVGRVEARPGMLDPTFGFEGRVGEVSGAAGSDGRRVALLPDGSARALVASGSEVLRFTSAGTLDPTFGVGGVVAGAGTIGDLAIDTGGAFLTLEGDFPPMELARYDGTGAPDLGFGIGGRVTIDFGDGDIYQHVRVLVRLADGRLVVAGDDGDIGTRELIVARRLADGSPGPSFGIGGTVRIAFGAGSRVITNAVLEQSDAKLVVIGSIEGPTNRFLGRLELDGTIDSGFGTAGFVIEPGPSFGAGALQPDGKIVVGGTFVLARYDSLGSPDPGFGIAGYVTTDLSFGIGGSSGDVVIDPDEKIVVGAQQPFPPRLTLDRFLPNGTPDVTFGGAGRVSGTFWAGSTAHQVAIASDGALVVAAGEVFTVLRTYLGGTCGNGALERGEECDDGNTAGGDTCEADCCIIDLDADGVCDAIDPCVGGVPMQKSLFKTGKWEIHNRDLLTIRAEFQLSPAQVAGLDPPADGMRILVDDAIRNRLEVAIPPAAQFEPSDIHWETRGVGTWSWSGRVVFGSAPGGSPPAGIYSVLVRGDAGTGRVKLKAKGRGGLYREDSQNPPYRLRVVVGSPLHGTGLCSEVHYAGPPPAPSCKLSTSRLTCK